MRRAILPMVLVSLALGVVAPAASAAPPHGLTYEVTCPDGGTFEVTGIGTPQAWMEAGPPALLMGAHVWRTEDGVTTDWAWDPPAALMPKLVRCTGWGPLEPDVGFSMVYDPAWMLFVGKP